MYAFMFDVWHRQCMHVRWPHDSRARSLEAPDRPHHRKGMRMTRFHSQESVDAPLDQVVRWHSLPGAVTRLSPHWAQTVVREGDPSAPGTRTHMKIAAPGSRGAIRVPWVSEHFALDDADIAPLTAPVELTAPTSTAHGFGDRMVESPRAPMRSWEHRHVFRADPSRTPGASRSPAPRKSGGRRGR